MEEIVCIRVWKDGRECWWPMQDYLTNPRGCTFTVTGKQPYPEPVIVAEMQYPIPFNSKQAAAEGMNPFTGFHPPRDVKFAPASYGYRVGLGWSWFDKPLPGRYETGVDYADIRFPDYSRGSAWRKK